MLFTVHDVSAGQAPPPSCHPDQVFMERIPGHKITGNFTERTVSASSFTPSGVTLIISISFWKAIAVGGVTHFVLSAITPACSVSLESLFERSLVSTLPFNPEG